ncbi:hypothetical protein SeMB42_g04192 [Synchytrium endobioticum]|uniref:non-specific serine/threonine protein kinase n=1 Tax=Synchytrium endobioticum TaxID=286115 RepID=A0A507DH76_9FUNG|nr:hypothetical protein SeMB42_g04192 [Synchytrium endobioticum]TPX50190.1 hypothetical protein SeLEV6574_g01040 [Synchytrium endobioticum]
MADHVPGSPSKTNPASKIQSIGHYVLDRTLGEGNFAKVRLATHTLTGQKVAVKIIDKTKLDKATAKKLHREVRIMKMLSHPHIVKLYEVIETQTELYLVLEYVAGGEIFDYLVAHGRMKEKEARRHFKQILSAVEYCHNLRIIHRDLKAENLLLDDNLNVKIADFGFSNQFNPNENLNTWCGSPPYAAPELFQGKEYSAPPVDIWSLGVVLYVLVCGSLPFDGSTLPKLRDRVLLGEFHVPFFMSSGCERLIKKMLVVNPSKRATIVEIKGDVWFREDGYELVQLPPYLPAPEDLTDEQRGAILTQLEAMGLDSAEVEASVKSGQYDHLAATFYLMADKFVRKGLGKKSNDELNLSAATPAPNKDEELPPLPRNPTTIPSHEAHSSDAREIVALKPPAQMDSARQRATTDVPHASRGSVKHEPGPSNDSLAVPIPVAQRRPQPSIDKPRPQSAIVLPAARRRAATVTAPVNINELKKELLESNMAKAVVHSKPNVAEQSPQSNDDLPVPRARPSSSSANNRPLSCAAPSSRPPPSSLSPMRVPPPSSPSESTTLTNNAKGSSIVRRPRGATIALSRNSKNSVAEASESEPRPNDVGRQSPAPPRARTPVINSTPHNADLDQQVEPTQAPSKPGRKTSRIFKTPPLSGNGKQQKKEPRTLRFSFSMSTTSTKDPDALISEIERVLKILDIRYEIQGYMAICVCSDIEFEVEICKLPRLSVNGLRFKRLAGEAWGYKAVTTDLIAKLQL